MTFRPKTRPKNGFNLIELLLTVAVLGVVLAGLSRIMIAENKLALQTGRDLDIRDALKQNNQLLRSEIALSSRITTNTSGLSDTCKDNPTPALVLVGPGDAWRISYGIRDATAAEKSSEWFGPALLIRCGKPYSASAGGIDVSQSEAKTVALDRLVSSTGFSATVPSGNEYASNNSTITLNSLNASIKLNLLSDTGKTISSTLQAGIAGNQLYGTLENPTVVCSSPSYKCSDSTEYIDNYRPPEATTTITGSLSKEVVVFFPKKLSEYTISTSPACTTSQCIITNVTVKNASLLVFKDQELRLPSP
jgi:prepilin-type N-terminal cleavage/methylation domain-containing protein